MVDFQIRLAEIIPRRSLTREVILGRIILHHSPGTVFRGDGRHGPADFPDPLPRNPGSIPVVKRVDHLLLQHFVEIFTVDAVLLFDSIWMMIPSDGESVGAIISFPPPSVHDAHVQTAVSGCFLSTGPGGFQRAPRIVQPHIATGDHLASNVNVIILKEHKMPMQLGVLAEVYDCLLYTSDAADE